MPDLTDQPHSPAVYLAGPDVFRQNAVEHGAQLVATCAQAGLRGLYPLDAELGAHTHDSPSTLAAAIASANMGLIRQSCAVIADLSPFRGPNVDDGTAFEIGYAHALGLPIFGYVCTGAHAAPYPERVRASGETLTTITHDNRPTLVDETGMMVEDFGLPVNLMIATILHEPGHIFTSATAAIAAAATHLRSQNRP